MSNEYETWLEFYLKCIKVAFSNKQIVETKKELHIDPIFTYFESEIPSRILKKIQIFIVEHGVTCSCLHHFNFSKKLLFWIKETYRISSYSFHPWIELATISKFKIEVSKETIWGIRYTCFPQFFPQYEKPVLNQ